MDLFSSDSAQIDEDLSIVDDIVLSFISQEENSILVVIPSANVIHDAVFAMDALLAPKPDSFYGRFFQRCWEILGRDVILTVQNFFHFGMVAPSLNSNFIVLLLKMRDLITVDQFCPIVLGNFLFKISSKILADKLAQLQKPQRGYITSSIWSSFRTNYVELIKDGICLIGEDSKRDFWRENWLGVPILDLLGILDFLATHLQAKFGLYGRPGKAPVIKSVVWSPPAPGWIKVNTDGAALGSPASLTINYAWNLGWHKIWLESDSSDVVQLISVRSDQVESRLDFPSFVFLCGLRAFDFLF
ncbi:hypothetical protein Ddye_023863 [Dipteronia dyeriana]|uniref:RNase H type-1 domain-containing protein n=1 Tax=Dipteronia dyeriana TaxID=168575 RepID=A0AAD9TUQ0_9ROSI|nr:hypothetical protein Ddye_023863 [Dipteronia dyeriana]